ncbi:hypothetical protein QR680_014235 [Steinernema hermaphroditum]|uniref:Secreted protein n=1 Tax=Steinernema hermaphroditum TaxID=289476 RepID=A0AA39I869_9BILA|nr:hypothetical protein QR680_014235 [Steinernema hermaphroditum]
MSWCYVLVLVGAAFGTEFELRNEEAAVAMMVVTIGKMANGLGQTTAGFGRMTGGRMRMRGHQGQRHLNKIVIILPNFKPYNIRIGAMALQTLNVPELEQEMEDSCGSLKKLFSVTCFNFIRRNAIIASALFGGDDVTDVLMRVKRSRRSKCHARSTSLKCVVKIKLAEKMADGLCKLAAGTSSLTHQKPEAYNDDDDYTL